MTLSRRVRPLAGPVAVLVLITGLTGLARPVAADTGVEDTFSLMQMVHTAGASPVPWDGSSPGGPFRYSSIPCSGNAPVNNISTDLTTYNSRVPGSRSPASTRSHPLEFSVRRGADGVTRMEGSDTLTVCKLGGGPTTPAEDATPDPAKEKIFFNWTATVERTSAEEVRWAGTFRITGGTGLYADLTGAGDIAGYFFCFDPAGCGNLGQFRDGQFTMQGTYHDPTVPAGVAATTRRATFPTAPTPPANPARGAGLEGQFSLLQMVHKQAVNQGPASPLSPAPWNGTSTGGPFRYASIPCNGNAPVNNISTDLTTYNARLPGSRVPASTRSHPLEFSVSETGGRLRLEGRDTLTVCQLQGGVTTDDPASDVGKSKIFFTWSAEAERTSPEEVKWAGTFRITGGTGVYEDLTGEGTMAGYFFCFAPAGCASLGEFQDGQFTMQGNFRDPSVPGLPGGYWLVAEDGGVFSFGAPFFGSTGNIRLNQPIVGMAATPTGRGYWLVAADGGIFAFGDAPFRGSTGAIRLNQPVRGMAATPSGQGYWLVAADGGIFAFGDATFHGSTGAIRLNQPIRGMASTPTGRGYWLVASDGGVFAFGDAVFRGSTGNIRLNQPMVGMSRSAQGGGYRLVASDGGIFAFGDATFHGSTGAIRLNQPILGMAATPTSRGYWLVASDGGIFAFGDAPFLGSTGAIRLNRPMVGMAPRPA